MVVSKAHIEGFGTLPSKDKSPLVVDSDAMKPGQIPLQGFKVIARRGFKVPQIHGSVQHVKFPQSTFEDGWRELPGVLRWMAIEKGFSGFVAE
jgi:hypothetical protein